MFVSPELFAGKRRSRAARLLLLAAVLPATVAFIAGAAFLVFTDRISHLQFRSASLAWLASMVVFARLTRANDPDKAALKVELRDGREADSDALYAIHEAAMRDYVAQTWGDWDEAFQHTHWRDHWFPAREVIDVDGEMAGFLDLDERGDHVWVENIELAPRFQGQGIGTTILRDIQRDAAERGLGVRLQVLKVNPARRLYERLGFEVTGESETHWQMAWTSKASASD